MKKEKTLSLIYKITERVLQEIKLNNNDYGDNSNSDDITENMTRHDNNDDDNGDDNDEDEDCDCDSTRG